MYLSRSARVTLGAFTGVILALIYLPLGIVLVNSFSTSRNLGWPPPGFTLEWWGKALRNTGALDALVTSVEVALLAALVSLVLGTLAALALARHDFFGKQGVNLLIVLPIALPGIVTGIALNNAFRTLAGVPLSLWTVVVAHATFCIVVVFNNAFARLRATGTRLEEASGDLGAGRWATFWLITMPQLRSALVAGALLAFGLSFDEIIVTTFTAGAGTTTLPLWILQNMFRPSQAPVVAVIAVVLIAASVVPLALAQRLTSADGARR